MTLGERNGTLGTFGGVFTPSILTILGIILFLRLGFVVGDAGLLGALLMIGLATAVSVLTSISLSAIATNIEVGGGGVYYLISRTLGVEFGGAIGIVLYLAQTVSIAFYAVGFGEALAGMTGWTVWWGPQAIAAVAVVLLFGFAWGGTDIANRFQFVVMAILVGSADLVLRGGHRRIRLGRGVRGAVPLVRIRSASGWSLRSSSRRSPDSPRASRCREISVIRARVFPRAPLPPSASPPSCTCRRRSSWRGTVRRRPWWPTAG